MWQWNKVNPGWSAVKSTTARPKYGTTTVSLRRPPVFLSFTDRTSRDADACASVASSKRLRITSVSRALFSVNLPLQQDKVAAIHGFATLNFPARPGPFKHQFNRLLWIR